LIDYPLIFFSLLRFLCVCVCVCWLFLRKGHSLFPWSAWIWILLFVLPCVAGMTSARHCTQTLIEMRS
jgi:hypothetical protein